MSDGPHEILKTALDSWLRGVPPGASSGVWFADALDALECAKVLVEAARELVETPEILMYGSHEAVSAGHIGYCVRRLNTALAPFVGEAA